MPRTPPSATCDGHTPLAGGTGERVARIELDGRGEIVALDDHAESLLGAGETRQGHLADLAIEADRVPLRELLRRVHEERQPLRGEFGLRCADGHVLSTAILVVPGDGNAAGLTTTAFLHDISSRHATVQVLAAIQAMTSVIAQAPSPERALQSLVTSLGRSMGWDVGGFWALSPEEALLELLAAWRADGGGTDALMPRQCAFAGSLAEPAFASGQAVWAHDLSHAQMIDPAGDGAAAGLHGAVVVPVMRAGAPRGALAFLSASPREPERETLQALSVAGAQVGELLGMLQERLDAVDSLRRLALTDELTGLPNRRAWEEAVRRELARAVRDHHPVCIPVLDLDGFKRFNDEHGHQAGDHALALAARAWQSQMRSSDILARYGG